METRKLTEVPEGEMSAGQLEWLERVVNRLPGKNPQFGRVDHERYGTIYFATKIDEDRMYHGVWACRGTGRYIDFKPDSEIDDVRQLLINDAALNLEDLVMKGIFRG